MSHLLESWLAESRKTNPGLQAVGSTIIDVDPGLTVAYRSGGTAEVESVKRSRTVLVAVEKPMPLLLKLPGIFPPTIVPTIVDAPTKILVGDTVGGGLNMPWTNGPSTIIYEEWPIGSILFYIGNRVAISIGIYDQGDSMRDLLVSYHRRGVKLRVHTGIGRASNTGLDSRERDRDDTDDPGSVMVPHGRPPPPTGGGGEVESRFLPGDLQEAGRGMDEPWTRYAPEMRPVDKFKANAKDLFRFFTPWFSEPGSWLR